MNTADLLHLVFTDHEADAPDVTRTLASIEAEIHRTSHRRPVVALTACAGAAAAVVAIAVASAGSGSDLQTRHDAPATGQAPSTPRVSSGTSAQVTHPPTRMIGFRADWLPPNARLNDVELTRGRAWLEGYSFGSVASARRGLTLWVEDGPLMTSLRDGGTLRSVTVRGRKAVEGYSALGHKYTVSILLADDRTMTVTAYGFDRATSMAYATHTAREIEYGDFPAPTPTGPAQ